MKVGISNDFNDLKRIREWTRLDIPGQEWPENVALLATHWQQCPKFLLCRRARGCPPAFVRKPYSVVHFARGWACKPDFVFRPWFDGSCSKSASNWDYCKENFL